MAEHTCALSNKSTFGKRTYSKKIENLIMHKYKGDKEEPKMNEIIVYAQGECLWNILFPSLGIPWVCSCNSKQWRI